MKKQQESQKDKKKNNTPKKINKKGALILSDDDYETISKAFEISINDNDVAYVSNVGANIRKIDPSFDTRSYGFYSLTKLFDNLDEFEIIKNEVGDLNHPLIKRVQ